MHKRHLWIDVRGSGLYWPAAGNVDTSATGKGTLAYWTKAPNYSYYQIEQYLWRIWVDSDNFVSSRGRGIRVKSGGTSYHSGSIDNNIPTEKRGKPEFHVLTWDFAAGEIRAYYDDATAAHDPVTGVPAPVSSPAGIYPGPTYVADWASAEWWIQRCANQEFYLLGIWDEVMSEAQISALYAQGHHTCVFQPDDGPGTLTFRLKFDNGLAADIAEGEGDWAQDDGASADRFCLAEDGIRTLGTAIYPLGTPRHDESADDRKPLHSVCLVMYGESNHRNHTTDTNETNYAKLKLEGLNVKRGGAYYPATPKPGTYRQLIHVPDNGVTPAGYEMGIGPIAYIHYPFAGSGVYDWGSGRSFQVVSDGGNSASSFKTNLGDFADDYWNGAVLTFVTGNCVARRLLVTDWDNTTKFITVEANLPATPGAGSIAVVNPYSRICGQDSTETFHEHCIEASLWARHDSSRHFVQLEWYNAPPANGQSVPTLRYEKGRTVSLPGCGQVTGGRGSNYGMWYWDDGYYDQPGGTNLEIWLEKIEIGGPQTYQILRRDARGHGPALADNFMVMARDSVGSRGDSVKVWHEQNMAWHKQRPTKISDYQSVTADLQASGTWRYSTGPPIVVDYDADAEVVTAAIDGTDSGGTTRLGYIQGHWDDEIGRIVWEDETPPTGKSNPVLDTATLRFERESDSPRTEFWSHKVIQALDGTWSLMYGGRTDTADEASIYALHGAPDRWSFDHASQFAGEVVTKGGKGIDIMMPWGNGYHPWGNAHIYGPIFRNPYAQATERQYLAFMSAKTIFHNGTTWNDTQRPVVTFAGTDIKSLAPLPYNREISPGPAPEAHQISGDMLGQEDCIGLLIEWTSGATCGIGLYTSEDALHFQELWPTNASLNAFIPQGELSGEGTRLVPGATFRLGDKRIYYYFWGSYRNFAWCRYNGETWYSLDDTQTAGYLETAILERPAAGWGEVYFNVELNDGDIEVEVLDPATEQPVAGYGLDDYDGLNSGLDQQLTWQSAGLSELTNDYLRLRIHVSRPQATDDSPQLFAWELRSKVLQYPAATELKVEGKVNPANVLDPTPTFSWTYYHAAGKQQSAYQIIVASSMELLENNIGDLWDSGVVLSSETTATYPGTALQDQQTYFWKVRVRSSEGVWSEEW